MQHHAVHWTDCGNRAGIDSTSDVMLVEAQLPPSLLALSCIHSHAPLPASISPRNAHCKLQTIAHSLSVHMCVSPCACVRVCVFPCRMPIVCARMDFCRWTEWIAATVQASIDDNGKLAHLEAQLPPSFLALLVCGQHAACLTVALSSRGRWVGGSCG